MTAAYQVISNQKKEFIQYAFLSEESSKNTLFITMES